MLRSVFTRPILKRRISTAQKPIDPNKLILYGDDDYVVLNKACGMSTFGQKEGKQSIVKILPQLCLENVHKYTILYKLHSNVGGCLLLCKNKFVRYHFYKNIFLVLVYGKVERKNKISNNKDRKEEIRMHLKYVSNSNIMIPMSNYENMNNFKRLHYSIVSNSIVYNKHQFSLLKIYINADDAKYIAPLLFYSLHTCIVGDNEYVNVGKKLVKTLFPKICDTNDVVNARRHLLKRISERKEKTGELKLHLHCFNVTFESNCNQVVSIFSSLPSYFRDTLIMLGAGSLAKKLGNEVKREWRHPPSSENSDAPQPQPQPKPQPQPQPHLVNMHEYSHADAHAYVDTGAPVRAMDEGSQLYDAMRDSQRMEEENELLLSKIYKGGDVNRRKQGRRGEREKGRKIRRGVLAKDVNRLTQSDAPIYFTDACIHKTLRDDSTDGQKELRRNGVEKSSSNVH
ncbi:conserved Plasmodium protein, unknown function [Plasmodium ovale curtisi]|uniref:Pseudouridine synthase n=1 Tax=Plasmodium ovale curtisi TaxID=864141 RepID=A0A1A8VPD8_PLAOA|nr:conserved Plasmodium protein, unknown function [Plasmodium ovale curtisi]